MIVIKRVGRWLAMAGLWLGLVIVCQFVFALLLGGILVVLFGAPMSVVNGRVQWVTTPAAMVLVSWWLMLRNRRRRAHASES